MNLHMPVRTYFTQSNSSVLAPKKGEVKQMGQLNRRGGAGLGHSVSAMLAFSDMRVSTLE